MAEPNGFEYVLETTSQRTTSIVVRKSPNLCTLVQKTAHGIGIVELSEEAKNRVLELLREPVKAMPRLEVGDVLNMGAGLPFEGRQLEVFLSTEPSKRKPGRPPKS